MLDQCDCTCGLDDVSVTELCNRFRPNFPIQTNLLQLRRPYSGGVEKTGETSASHGDSEGLPTGGVCLRMNPL